MGRGRLSTLTKESVKVDLPWSTWAMTDMLRIFRFLSIKARISSTVKLTYEPTTINDWRKEREKNKFYKSRLHNTYSTKQEKSKGTSKATHLFLCVCLTRINFVCFVQNIPRHFVFFFSYGHKQQRHNRSLHRKKRRLFVETPSIYNMHHLY